MVIRHRWHVSPGLRRALTVTAVAVVVIGGVKVASCYSTPGSGFSTIATGAADPTGPTGGPDPGGMNGGQFQPPGLPPQQPDYQGGINQPPLDQNGGISIYNTGVQGAPQQAPGQQGGRQPQGQQPQHGTQIPDYQTATPYTQGPGRANPDYQVPQQSNQGPQPQQGSQQATQAPTQQPTLTQAPTQTQVPTPSQQPTGTTQPGQEAEQNNSDQNVDTDDFDDSEVPDEQNRMDNGIDKKICEQSMAEMNAGKPISNIDWFTMIGNNLNGSEMRVENATRWPDMVRKGADEWKGLGINVSYFTPAWYRQGPYNADVKVVETTDPNFKPYGKADWPNRIIYINTRLLEKEHASDARIQETITHEIGHALGLMHGCAGTIMQRVHELSDGTIRPGSPTALDKAVVKQIHQK